MGHTMEQQKAVASQMAKRYRQASKKKKGQIIEEYMGLTGCTRHHAAWLLRCWGTTVWDRQDGRLVKILVGQRRRRRHTRRVYDAQTVAAVTKLWRHFGYLCGKRLAAARRLWLANYESWDERSRRRIALTAEMREKLPRAAPRPSIGRCAPRSASSCRADAAIPSPPGRYCCRSRSARSGRTYRPAPWVWTWSATTVAAPQASRLHAAGHRPPDAVDGDATRAEPSSEVGVPASAGSASPATLRSGGHPQRRRLGVHQRPPAATASSMT